MVITLAAARVTRLITTDDLTSGIREALASSTEDGEPIATEKNAQVPWYVRLVNCDWCVSIYVALAAMVAAKFTHLASTWTWAAWCWPAAAFGSAGLLRWQ